MEKTKNNATYGDPELSYLFDEENIEDSNHSVNNLPKGYTKEMYEDILTIVKTKVGEVVEGVLVGETESEYMFDIDAKDYIRVVKNKSEVPFFEGKQRGDIMEILVVGKSEVPFNIKGSVSAIHEAEAHETLTEIDFNDSVDVLVKEMSPAGYNLELYHEDLVLDAFMPHTLAGINRLHDQARQDLIGKSLKVMIESYSKDKGTYIVSRRKYLKTLIPQAINELEHGIVYTGHVTGSAPFGVFVEFNECLTGMVHKSNINPEVAATINDIKPGTEIDFYIKDIVNKRKIILTQILEETLWDTIEVGDKFTGQINSIKSFGAIVQIDGQTTGLIPVNELSKRNQQYSEGDSIDVKVSDIDRQSRRILLK